MRWLSWQLCQQSQAESERGWGGASGSRGGGTSCYTKGRTWPLLGTRRMATVVCSDLLWQWYVRRWVCQVWQNRLHPEHSWIFFLFSSNLFLWRKRKHFQRYMVVFLRITPILFHSLLLALTFLIGTVPIAIGTGKVLIRFLVVVHFVGPRSWRCWWMDKAQPPNLICYLNAAVQNIILSLFKLLYRWETPICLLPLINITSTVLKELCT